MVPQGSKVKEVVKCQANEEVTDQVLAQESAFVSQVLNPVSASPLYIQDTNYHQVYNIRRTLVGN